MAKLPPKNVGPKTPKKSVKKAAKKGKKKIPLKVAQKLSTQVAQDIVVKTTPWKTRFKGPDQPLAELGIINTTVAGVHKEKIRKEVTKLGGDIAITTIKSGPATSVGVCTDSVKDNAK